MTGFNNSNGSKVSKVMIIDDILTNNGHIRSLEKLKDVYKFCLHYPLRFIPVVDGLKFCGVLDRNKLRKLSKKQILRLNVEDMKEDSPYTALVKTPVEILIKEMNEKRIESVVIINAEFIFLGTLDIFSATTYFISNSALKSNAA